ncbi:MAG: DUF2946 family protein [Comamonadaceae bacterium]|jgi:hypothetical protein|nr:DUF2946 family protein [Comamonadaceae bacterium]
MDDIVKQALAKWPQVPACHGWLGLDARGRWYLRDAQVQAQGPFPQVRGTLVEHEKLLAFIGRNYEPDAQGCWFFQNGPQRVYVELEATPWIWRLSAEGTVNAHTGIAALVHECLLDEAGRGYLCTDRGLGLVHSLDVPLLAQWLEDGRWPLTEVQSADLPLRYGFVRSPAAGVQA